MSYKEMAETLGCPQGTVMSRLHSARQRLRELLEDAGGQCGWEN
jgi:DNA-directed RNA polymerase specialized sigma24 family protein